MAALTRWLHSRYLFSLIYLLAATVALAMLFYGQEKQRRTSEAACERGNLIRSQVDYNSDILRSLIIQAADARDQLAILHESQGDAKAAKIERDSVASFRRLLQGFHALGPAPCHDLYQRFH